MRDNDSTTGFRTSSFCQPSGGCVEVARDGHGAAIRDAKDKGSAVLRFTDAEWQAFIAGVKAGEFD